MRGGLPRVGVMWESVYFCKGRKISTTLVKDPTCKVLYWGEGRYRRYFCSTHGGGMLFSSFGETKEGGLARASNSTSVSRRHGQVWGKRKRGEDLRFGGAACGEKVKFCLAEGFLI